MNTIKLQNILSYHDGVGLFLGEDLGGKLYMVSFIEETETADTFFAVECTKDQYVQFLNLRIDLYGIIVNRPDLSSWYKVNVLGFDYAQNMVLEKKTTAFPDKYLPPRANLDEQRRESREEQMQICASFVDNESPNTGSLSKNDTPLRTLDCHIPPRLSNTPPQGKNYYENSLGLVA